MLIRALVGLAAGVLLSWCAQATCPGEELLFSDTFDTALSDRWEVFGLAAADYRVRNGALELRVQRGDRSRKMPLLRVKLPFSTSETVIASVEVTPIDQPLNRHEFAGLCLMAAEDARFSARKTNLDGYFVFAPGEVNFIGAQGEEGDPRKYTVKYWPADPQAGPLRIIVRQHYAHFQVGPSAQGDYRTFFHSAIQHGESGMGFGLMAAGESDDSPRWVRFDNFRVVRN